MLAILTCFRVRDSSFRLVRWIGHAIVSVGAPVQFTSEVLRFMMRSRLVILGVFLAFGVLPGPTHAAEIKIGAAEALTGNASQYGLPIRKGFELALSEINASGGINGRKIELVIEDEQGKKEEAINVFKKLIFQDKVLMLFGPTLSNSAQASDPVAQGAKVVVFGTSNTADGITSIGNYVFRNSVTEADILPVTLKIAAQKTGLKRVAVLYGNDDIFTKSGYDNFKKALQDLKIPVDDHGDVRQRAMWISSRS